MLRKESSKKTLFRNLTILVLTLVLSFTPFTNIVAQNETDSKEVSTRAFIICHPESGYHREYVSYDVMLYHKLCTIPSHNIPGVQTCRVYYIKTYSTINFVCNYCSNIISSQTRETNTEIHEMTPVN